MCKGCGGSHTRAHLIYMRVFNGFVLVPEKSVKMTTDAAQEEMPDFSEIIKRLWRNNMSYSTEIRLTPREKEVLSLMDQGMKRGEIAHQLDITPRLVSRYFDQVKDKVAPDEHWTRAQVLAYVKEHNLV